MDERFDPEKIDDAVLAMLFLTQAGEGRSWKSLDWDALDRLHAKGYISNPVGKAKSVVVTQEGMARAKALAEALFGKDD